MVDGAQATGTGPIDVKQLGCHVYATSGHKWLLGPPGTGFLYLSKELEGMVDPTALQSGRAAYSASSGTRSIPNLLGLGAAIEYVSATGLDRIEAHNLRLRQRLYEGLADVPRIRRVSGPAGPLASPMLTYRLPDEIDSSALQGLMRAKYRIELKVVPRNWFNGHRVSTHLFNSEEDVDSLLAALRTELT